MPKNLHTTSESGAFISPKLPKGAKRLVRMMSSSPEDGKVDPDVMRDYLAQASVLIRRGDPLPESLRTIIAESLLKIANGEESLLKIANGEDPARALHLKKSGRKKLSTDPARALHLKKSGRKKLSTAFRRGVITMVANLEGDGCSLNDAFDLVSKAITEPADRKLFDAYPISAEAVRKIWKSKERKK